MNPYIGDNAIDHMDSIMKNIFTPDELAEINNEIQMIEAAQEAHEKDLTHSMYNILRRNVICMK